MRSVWVGEARRREARGFGFGSGGSFATDLVRPGAFAAVLVPRGDFAADLVLRGDFAADLVLRGDFTADLVLLSDDLAADLVRRFADPWTCVALCAGSS